MMLHIVNKSPFEKNSLQTCLRLSGAGSRILLIEDGVYAAVRGTSMKPHIAEFLGDREIYALGPDLGARGIDVSMMIEGIEVTDYDGFVKLAVSSSKVQSWL